MLRPFVGGKAAGPQNGPCATMPGRAQDPPPTGKKQAPRAVEFPRDAWPEQCPRVAHTSRILRCVRLAECKVTDSNLRPKFVHHASRAAFQRRVKAWASLSFRFLRRGEPPQAPQPRHAQNENSAHRCGRLLTLRGMIILLRGMSSSNSPFSNVETAVETRRWGVLWCATARKETFQRNVSTKTKNRQEGDVPPERLYKDGKPPGRRRPSGTSLQRRKTARKETFQRNVSTKTKNRSPAPARRRTLFLRARATRSKIQTGGEGAAATQGG